MKKRTIITGVLIVALVGIAVYFLTVSSFSTESKDQNWRLVCCQSEGSPDDRWEGFLVYQGEDIDKVKAVSIDINIDGHPSTGKLEAVEYSPSIRYQVALRLKPQKIYRFLDLSEKPEAISGEIKWSVDSSSKITTVVYKME